MPNDEMMSNNADMKLADIGIKGKVFCLSMQRSGTTSVGDFLQQWKLKRAGHPLSRGRHWSRHWYNGNFEAIFSDPVFAEHEVFEDDPFWFPDFYKYVFHRMPGSRFILLIRNSDSWFKSMIHHSNGSTLGWTDIHAKVYRREDDLHWLENHIDGFKGSVPQGMMLYDKSVHYKLAYERHTREIRMFFDQHASNALFVGELNDQEVWKKIKEWLVLPDQEGVSLNVHAHKARKAFGVSDLRKFSDRMGEGA